MYYVYILRCLGNKLYIGVSQNPEQRFNEHIQKRGAEFTKIYTPEALVYTEKHPSFKEARNREIQIKKWTRQKKDHLIEHGHPTKKNQ